MTTNASQSSLPAAKVALGACAVLALCVVLPIVAMKMQPERIRTPHEESLLAVALLRSDATEQAHGDKLAGTRAVFLAEQLAPRFGLTTGGVGREVMTLRIALEAQGLTVDLVDFLEAVYASPDPIESRVSLRGFVTAYLTARESGLGHEGAVYVMRAALDSGALARFATN